MATVITLECLVRRTVAAMPARLSVLVPLLACTSMLLTHCTQCFSLSCSFFIIRIWFMPFSAGVVCHASLKDLCIATVSTMGEAKHCVVFNINESPHISRSLAVFLYFATDPYILCTTKRAQLWR